PLAKITVTPNPGSVVEGGSLAFSASGSDASGNPVSISPTWTATGGTVSSTGLYKAGTTAGSFTVTATSGSVSGSATVNVTAPPVLTTIAVTPNPASVATGGKQTFTAQGKDQNGNNISATYTWSATGGTITQAGVYTAGSQTGSFGVTATSGSVSGVASVTVTAAPVLTTITVTPNPASVVAGGTQTFTAQGKDQNGNNISATYTWSATGGTITQAGVYTAGSQTGSFAVTAKSGSVSGVAGVTITAQPTPVLTTIAVTPNPASVATGGTQTFTAQGKDQNGNNMSATFTWSATGGTITQAGVYTAGSQTGSFTVTATSGSVSGSASVTVTSSSGPPPSEVIVDNDTPGWSVISGTWTLHFSSSEYGSSERTLDNGNGVSQWTASLVPGTYDVYAWWDEHYRQTTATATYTIETASGNVTLTVNQLPSSTWGVWNKLGTWTFGATGVIQVAGGINVSADAVRFTPSSSGGTPPPVLTTITVTPNPATVSAGATQTFTAQGKDQNGNNMSATFTWSATGGTITQAGVYTAGQTAGTFSVTATSGSVSGSATVNVTTNAPPPVLTTITVTPNPATVSAGASQTFTAQGKDQNGNNMSATFTWSATGGTITQAGVYTAGQTGGTFSVKATSGNVSGSATVNVTANQPPPQILTSVVVSPNPASTTPSGTVTFTAQAKDQNGNNMSETFMWTASAGTIDQSGHYTAPASTGSFTVTASSQGISGHATVNVQSALATVIVDDSDPGWTVLSGEWDQHYESLHYGPTDHVIAVGSTGTCQWKPVLATGTYDVYAWIPERDSIPSCVGAYTIVTASGNVSVSLDQNTPSYWGTFVKLGSFQLNAGTALVQLTAAANQRVSADAMEFVQTGP
ncbi:MAG TPA: Ig-like domain-containing protein, partial [Planctomycetota bacterium]|nr:Ig-like domain-containing protein [Planctomycetota bacterium]